LIGILTKRGWTMAECNVILNRREDLMRKGIAICSLLLLAPLAFGAQHGRAATTGTAHSNAPSKASAASSDRDKGTGRAADVGKGKKKGLSKHASKHKHHKSRSTSRT